MAFMQSNSDKGNQSKQDRLPLLNTGPLTCLLFFGSLLLFLLLPTFAYDASLSMKRTFWPRSEKIRRWRWGKKRVVFPSFHSVSLMAINIKDSVIA